MKKALALFSLASAFLFGRIAGAVPVVEDKDKGIVVNVGALIQPQFQVTMPATSGGAEAACPARRCSTGIGSPNGTASYDLFLRRARLMLWGSATKQLSFFVDTDEPNLGKGGKFTTTTFIQDAFLSYAFIPELKVDAGLMLAPLSHHTLEGATSLNALDYHSDMIRFPTNTRIFRDAGVQLRGLALGDHLHYRLGIFEGVRNGAIPAFPAPTGMAAAPLPIPTLNPGGVPRFVGHLRVNILGSEPDFFFKGIYFSTTPIISVGGGVDWQPNSAITLNTAPPAVGGVPQAARLEYRDYLAASGDVFVEYPFTEADELIFKANMFYWAEGSTNTASTAAFALAYTGASAYYAEAGFRHAWIEPIAFVEYLKGRKDSVTILAPHGGVNVWVMKHNFNIKTDVGWRKTERKRENEPTLKDFIWTTQAQLFF